MTRAAAIAVVATLGLVAGCAGGGSSRSTTTRAPSTSSTEDVPAPSEQSTPPTTVDPTLQSLVLVAADVPGFKEQAGPSPTRDRSTSCDPAAAPAVKAISAAAAAEGATFERGPDGAVQVSSRGISSPDQAEAALTELVDPKLTACLQADLRAIVEKNSGGGAADAFKMTSAKSKVGGVDQTVILAASASMKDNAGVARTVLLDLVFLRSSGTILVVTYTGPSGMASVAERQRIVAVAGRKLAGSASGTSTTLAGGSTTSSTRRSTTTTTRRSTTTTHPASTTSSTKAATTSTTITTSTTA